MFLPALCLFLLARLPARKDHVTITVESTPQDDFWVAKRGGATLWKKGKLGYGAHSDSLDLSALSTFAGLLIVNRQGEIVYTLPGATGFDPRQVLISDHYLVYDDGVMTNGFGSGDPRVNLWGQTFERKIHVFDLKTMKPLWSEIEGDFGVPVSEREGRIELLRVTNGDTYVNHPGHTTPRFSIREINVHTEKTLKEGTLSLRRPEAVALFNQWIGRQRLKDTSVRWTARGVQVHVWGKRYSGTRDKMR